MVVKGTVVIDPGHGGTVNIGGSDANHAVSPSGALEKNMTLEIAKLVQAALRAEEPEVTVILTRTDDTNLSLEQRANFARDNHAELLLSIHFNGFNGQARGVETFVRPEAEGNVNHDADKSFAARVQNADIEFYLKLEKVTPSRPGGGVRVEIHFLDVKNQWLGKKVFGPWTGGKSWDAFMKNVKVPGKARKGIFFFILENAKGSARLDHARVTGHAETGPVTRLLESVTDTKNWKPFQAAAGPLSGALDASGLLDAPAGKHGFLRTREDVHFYFEIGRAHV